jgi:hypothetical protein
MNKKKGMSLLDQLTPREQKLVLELADGVRPTHAMIAAGYSRSYSYKQQWSVCRRPRIKRPALQMRLRIQYERKGPEFLEFLTDKELKILGINPSKYHERERRKMEEEAKRETWATVARLLRKR